MNRWNEYKKSEAIKMINNGMTNEQIAKLVGMSESSVNLLKYSVVKTNEERVICEICKKQMKQITHKHLKNHNINFEDYKNKYPNSKTATDYRRDAYLSFKSENKGKTYDEIYGKEEGDIKRSKISQKQIGRPSAFLAGTGISGTRKDTGMFARSTYEANIDRIFKLENKKIEGEFSEENSRVLLTKKDGTIITYQPDRIDVDGLFLKGAYLEIKGYMSPEGWEKICLFKEQCKEKRLLVISSDKTYLDINYKELENKYKNKIQLWEDEYQNYKKNPELYDVNYIEPEIVRFYRENYKKNIQNSIVDLHIQEMANRCISYCSVRLGKEVYIDEVKLIFISDRRPGSRISTGKYYFELWEITTHDKEKYYVTNQEKTTLFYCYGKNDLEEISKFFNDNNNEQLKFGPKEEFVYRHVPLNIAENIERKDVLKRIEDIFSHNAISNKITGIELLYGENTKRGAINNREEWKIQTEKDKRWYKLTNFGNATTEYKLIECVDE